ncbi:hypothetical protein TNCV_1843291 [Trichonephila clavipes]|nr:hypothetical protein TNCV_1843291 [Trichonephila clavipes]
MREKGGNRLVPCTDYMVDALKLLNQAPRVSSELLQKCVAWCCPDGTQQLFCWPILAISGQLLASNDPVVDSRDLNLVFGHVEETPNKLFLSSPTKYTVEPTCQLVLLLDDATTTNMPVNFDYFCDFIDIFVDGPACFYAKIVDVEIGGVTIYRPFGELRRANSYCHLYGDQGQRDRRTSSPFPR